MMDGDSGFPDVIVGLEVIRSIRDLQDVIGMFAGYD
jgi:hypothetical protein